MIEILQKRIDVLIETLWNVKFIREAEKSSARIVLIETLWNVKGIGERNFRIGK